MFSFKRNSEAVDDCISFYPFSLGIGECLVSWSNISRYDLVDWNQQNREHRTTIRRIAFVGALISLIHKYLACGLTNFSPLNRSINSFARCFNGLYSNFNTILVTTTENWIALCLLVQCGWWNGNQIICVNASFFIHLLRILVATWVDDLSTIRIPILWDSFTLQKFWNNTNKIGLQIGTVTQVIFSLMKIRHGVKIMFMVTLKCCRHGFVLTLQSWYSTHTQCNRRLSAAEHWNLDSSVAKLDGFV